jgi:hypothetical protein
VEECFGRYAPAIQAHSAKALISFDEDDFLTEVGGIKSCGITARTSAENHDFSLNWIHRKEDCRIIAYWSAGVLELGVIACCKEPRSTFQIFPCAIIQF